MIISIKLKFLTGIIMMLGISCQSQRGNLDLNNLETRLDSLIQSRMEADHIPGVAFIIVKNGETLLKKGYGYTSLGEEIRRVNPDSTIFRIGSITKTFTATALLQLVDQQKIDLYKDVNTYLTSIQVPETYEDPVTPAHLVNHSAGFDELRGRVVYHPEQSIPLKQFLQGRLVRIRAPGMISSYSSYGIALAGLLVEDVSNQSLEAFMKEHIWDPLGMDMTSMFLNDQVEQYASWGYEYRNGINLPQPWENYHTYPASEINSTVTDMGKYINMHLMRGLFDGERILSDTLALKMQQPELRVAPEIEAFAYGFYEEDVQGFRTISHGGDMLGYASYLGMVPEENLGFFVVHHHEGTRLRYDVGNLILSAFAKAEMPPMTQIAPMKTDLSKLAGHYMWTTYCHSCENSWRPDREELVVNGDGTFALMGRIYEQIKPLVFRSKDGSRTIGFITDEDGDVTYMSMGASNMFEKVD